MSWIAVGSIGGALVSGTLGSDASRSAANKQYDANMAGVNLQRDMWNQSQANLQPYMRAGSDATGRLSDLMGTSANTGAQGYGSLTGKFTGQDYLNNADPSYQFQLQQGQNALQNSQAAGSGALSGAAMKSLMGYNQDYASTGYQNAFNRWQSNNNNIYSRLTGLAGLGENAAAGSGNNAAQVGQSVAGSMANAGNALAAGGVGQTNAWMGALNSGMGYAYMANMLNKGNGKAGLNNGLGYGTAGSAAANAGDGLIGGAGAW